MNYKERLQLWLDSQVIDEETKNEIKSITSEEELEDRFYTNLAFGTAGLRGKIGAGSNRMNRYTVGKATEGLARTLEDYGEEALKKGVAIAYDVRHFSREFAEIASGILASHGIHVHLFEDIRPTPMLSYAVRELGTMAGIVVTASHNPQEYNGYKVYWKEGSQILEDVANQILGHIDEIDFKDIAFMDLDEGIEKGYIHMISKELDDKYYDEVLAMAIRDEDIDKEIKVIYTPLNGTGNIPVRHVLKERGFKNIEVVPEQEEPDGDFTTVGYPNPEDVKAFDMALEQAKASDAELILATDPDCDRVSMMCKRRDGEYQAFNGNQIGALLIHYILGGLDEKGEIPSNGAIVKSIVTGELGTVIAKEYDVPMFETLTGFKNICALPNEWDETGEYKFIFGYEESIGYTYGDFVRDKDAVVSSMMIVEMAAYYKQQDKTLVEVLEEIYETYGYYDEKLISLVLEGIEGQERIGRMMDDARHDKVNLIGDMKLEKTIDYLHDETDAGKSNVLRYFYDDGSWYAVRPSGTEPKIKLYIYVKGKTQADAEEKIEMIEEAVLTKMHAVK